MIQAINDKVIAEVLIRAETKGGIVIPDNAILDPQGYGRIISVGEDVPDTLKVGDIITFHMNGGMATVFKKQTFKVLKYDEIYGKVVDEEIIEELDIIKIDAFKKEETSPIIRPVS
jgi:co-chaperonin GroES (HSP10)